MHTIISAYMLKAHAVAYVQVNMHMCNFYIVYDICKYINVIVHPYVHADLLDLKPLLLVKSNQSILHDIY